MEQFYSITELIREQLLNDYYFVNERFFNDMVDETIEEDESFDELQALIETECLDDEDEDIEITDEDYVENYSDFLKYNTGEELDSVIDTQTLEEIKIKIDSSKYKNLIYLILLQDSFEYIKVISISGIALSDDKKQLLEFLETWELNQILNKIKTSDAFYYNLLTYFFEYHMKNTIENRIINKKLVELLDAENNLNKFKIGVYDDMQYQYAKKIIN